MSQNKNALITSRKSPNVINTNGNDHERQHAEQQLVEDGQHEREEQRAAKGPHLVPGTTRAAIKNATVKMSR